MDVCIYVYREIKAGGAYYLISRSIGPEVGGSVGVLFWVSE